MTALGLAGRKLNSGQTCCRSLGTASALRLLVDPVKTVVLTYGTIALFLDFSSTNGSLPVQCPTSLLTAFNSWMTLINSASVLRFSASHGVFLTQISFPYGV